MKKNSLNVKITLVFLAIYILIFGAIFLFKLEFSLQSCLLSFGGLFGIWLLGHRLDSKYYIGAQAFLLVAEVGGAALFLYKYISFYDIIMHLCSGILLSFLGEYTLKLFNKNEMPKVNGIIRTSYSFMFAVACAGLWEIWEYAGDTLFGFDSQLGSLEDTMTDIIAGTCGAAIGVIILLFIRKITDKKIQT